MPRPTPLQEAGHSLQRYVRVRQCAYECHNPASVTPLHSRLPRTFQARNYKDHTVGRGGGIVTPVYLIVRRPRTDESTISHTYCRNYCSLRTFCIQISRFKIQTLFIFLHPNIPQDAYTLISNRHTDHKQKKSPQANDHMTS